jgi:hypothetical protein
MHLADDTMTYQEVDVGDNDFLQMSIKYYLII